MKSSKNGRINIDWLCWGLILVFSIFIGRFLLSGGSFSGYDYGGALMRLLAMNLYWGHDQWMVRWAPDMYTGYGYPLFNFYPPLFYILGTLIAKTGVNLTCAVDLSLFVTLFFSGVAMYALAREWWGVAGGVVSAVAYLFIPYHIVDLYVRGAAAETASFVFLPLILWSFYKLNQTASKRYILFAALSVAGSILTHFGVAMIFFPLVPLYILMLAWPWSDRRQVYAMISSFIALICGVGLSAFFWLPAMLESKFVRFEDTAFGNADFHNQFLSFQRLIDTSWGYNLPVYGAVPRMSCQIGLVHVLLVAAVLIGFKKIVKDRPELKKQIVFLIMAIAVSIFFTLPVSAIIWEHIRAMKLLEFPFRFLTITAFVVSALAGAAILLAPQKYRWIAAIGAVVLIVTANSSYCHPRESHQLYSALNKTDSVENLHYLYQQDDGEYLPIWAKTMHTYDPAEKLENFTQGGQVLDKNKISPLRYEFKVLADYPSSMFCFNVFYFPGWQVKIDGIAADILYDNPFGLIIFQVPEGTHEIKIFFGTTEVRQVAKGITMGTVFLLSGILIFAI